MKRLISILVALLAFAGMAKAQTERYNNVCSQGAAAAVVSGLQSSNMQVSAFRYCTVTVYLTGTGTLATLYADRNNTPLSNPFTASQNGMYSFYAATANNYDVVMSGPNMTTTTIPDVALAGGSTGGGLSGQTTNYLPVATSVNASTTSSYLQDLGTELIYHGSGTSRGIAFPQGTAITPTSGQDIFFADTSTNRMNLTNNGGTASPVATLADFAAPVPIGGTTPNSIMATMLGATSRTLTSGVANCGLSGPLFFTTCDQTAFTSYNSGPVLQTGSNLTLNSYGTGGGSGGPTMVEGKYTAAHSDNDLFADAGGGQSYSINATKYGVGDFLVNNWIWFNAAGCAYSSDQCSQGLFMNGGQIYGYPHLTIATGGTGSQSPTFTASASGCGAVVFACLPEPGSRLIDITQGGPNRYFSGASVPFTGASISYLRQLPTTGGAGALPIASAWGYQSAANINPGGLFSSPVSETVTIATGSGSFTTGKVCVVGNNWVEQSNITGVTGSAGAQTITLPLGRPNVSVFLIQGSHTCDLLSFDATFNLTGTRSSYVAVGSIDGTNLIYANEGFSAVGLNALPQAGAEPETTAGASDPNSQFHTYCAARIWQDVTIGAPPTVSLEPNSCNFATGDAVEVPDFDIQQQQAMQVLVNQNAPSGASTHMNGLSVYISGMGAANSGDGIEVTNNQANLAWYQQGGGNLTEPNCALCVNGYWNYDRVQNYTPYAAVDNFSNVQAGQTSFDWIRNPLAGPVTISSGLFYFRNAGIQVQQGGVFATNVLAQGFTTGPNDTVTGVGVSGVEFTFPGGPSATYIAGCSMNPFGGGMGNSLCVTDNVRSSAAVAANHALYGGQLGGVSSVFTGTAGLLGFASGMPLTPSCDTGLSRDAAGVIDVGNCTAADKSGSMKMTNLTLTGTCTGCGGGGISGLTAGYIPLAGSATTITGNSHIDDGVTTASTLTATEQIAAPSFRGTTTGSGSSSISLPNNTGNIPTLASNSGGFAGPASGGTSYLYKLPATVTAGLLWQAAPATNEGVNESALSTATGAQVSSVIQNLTGCNTATYVFTPQANDCVAPGGSSFPDITDSAGTVGINNASSTGTTTVNIGTSGTSATSSAVFQFGNTTAIAAGANSTASFYVDNAEGFHIYSQYGAMVDVSNNGSTVIHNLLYTYGGISVNGGLNFAGTTFTVTGCGTATSLTGGQLGGKFTAASATCTPVVTTGLTAAHGFSCWMNDQTTPAVRFTETASTTTTATFTATGTLGSTDTINFGCVEY